MTVNTKFTCSTDEHNDEHDLRFGRSICDFVQTIDDSDEFPRLG
jgi:hypothetical protein